MSLLGLTLPNHLLEFEFASATVFLAIVQPMAIVEIHW